MSKAIKSGLTNYYFYDANGKRVRRIVNGTQSTTTNETWMVYGFDGELVAEYAYNGATSSPQKEYGYRNEQLLIVADNSDGSLKVRWEVADHLGSPRMSIRGTGSDGGSLASVTRHDYLPFGEEVFAGARRNAQNQGQYGYEPPDDGVRQNFTGYERDDETGLDYAQARYYSSGQGRFTSVDPLMASGRTWNPQSWNRYAYTLNRPLSLIDPSGLIEGEPDDVLDPQSGRKKKEKEEEGKVVIKTIDGPKNVSVKVNQIDKVPKTGELPVGGEFEIIITYTINLPPEGKHPGDYAQITSLNAQPGKPDTGTFTESNNLTKTGAEVEVEPKTEAVTVVKTERFILDRVPGGTGAISFKVTVTDPVNLADPKNPNSPPRSVVFRTKEFPTVFDKNTLSYIPTRNVPKTDKKK